MKAIFLICLITFANLNIHIYQNWCHGENIGYTINSKKFDSPPEDISLPTIKKDNCCKDILIQSNDISFFSYEKNLQLSISHPGEILPNYDFSLNTNLPRKEKKNLILYSNPPPEGTDLYKFYCQYTYYG